MATTEIDEWDLRIDTYRNEARVRVMLTHLPTGYTAAADHPRSQLEAKRMALHALTNQINKGAPQHTFTVRYKVIGRSINDQLADWADLDHQCGCPDC